MIVNVFGKKWDNSFLVSLIKCPQFIKKIIITTGFVDPYRPIPFPYLIF